MNFFNNSIPEHATKARRESRRQSFLDTLRGTPGLRVIIPGRRRSSAHPRSSKTQEPSKPIDSGIGNASAPFPAPFGKPNSEVDAAQPQPISRGAAESTDVPAVNRPPTTPLAQPNTQGDATKSQPTFMRGSLGDQRSQDVSTAPQHPTTPLTPLTPRSSPLKSAMSNLWSRIKSFQAPTSTSPFELSSTPPTLDANSSAFEELWGLPRCFAYKKRRQARGERRTLQKQRLRRRSIDDFFSVRMGDVRGHGDRLISSIGEGPQYMSGAVDFSASRAAAEREGPDAVLPGWAPKLGLGGEEPSLAPALPSSPPSPPPSRPGLEHSALSTEYGPKQIEEETFVDPFSEDEAAELKEEDSETPPAPLAEELIEELVAGSGPGSGSGSGSARTTTSSIAEELLEELEADSVRSHASFEGETSVRTRAKMAVTSRRAEDCRRRCSFPL